MIERAAHRRETGGAQTILFLDEIHRFNKAQQDALLPAVEDGLVTLIGATTENPAFEVNGALLSRLRVYALQALSAEELTRRSCAARRRGDRRRSPRTRSSFLATRSEGDARTALNALELAIATAGSSARTRSACARAEDALQRRAVALRQRRRSPLRLHLGLDQGDTRLGSGRLALLPGGDARGRRGPALHRAADGDPRLRGHRQRRSGRRCASRPRRPPRSSTWACPRRATRSPRPRSTSRSRRSPTPPDGRCGGAARTCASTAPRRRRRGCARATAGPERGDYENPHRLPGHVGPQELAPEGVAASASTHPDEAEAALAERLAPGPRDAGARGWIIAARWRPSTPQSPRAAELGATRPPARSSAASR